VKSLTVFFHSFRQPFGRPKPFILLALERSKQIKLKTLDADCFFDDIAGDVK
jgi:hypothetical protein